MNALTALDAVGGSTPDKDLLAAQIRANFESLVRASPSPMVMERGAVLRTSPLQPQPLTWGSPPALPVTRPHSTPASAQRLSPTSQPSPVALLAPQQGSAAGLSRAGGAAAGPPARSQRLGGLHTPITARSASHSQGSWGNVPSTPLLPPPTQQRHQHPPPAFHQHAWQQQPPAGRRAVPGSPTETAGGGHSSAEREPPQQGAATPLSAAPQRHTPVSSLVARPQAGHTAVGSQRLPPRSPATSPRQRSQQPAQQQAPHSVSAPQPASASRRDTREAAEPPATPSLQLQAAASPVADKPPAQSAGQQQPEDVDVKPLRSPGSAQRASRRTPTFGVATLTAAATAAGMPADEEQHAAYAGLQPSSQSLLQGTAALPADSYAVPSDGDAAPMPDADLSDGGDCATGDAQDADAEVEIEPAEAAEPIAETPAPAPQPAATAEMPTGQPEACHVQFPMSARKQAASGRMPVTDAAQPPPPARRTGAHKAGKRAVAKADAARQLPTSPAAAFAAQRARARAQEAEQQSAAPDAEAAGAAGRSSTSAERPEDITADGAEEPFAKRRTAKRTRASVADAVTEAAAPSGSHAHVGQRASQPVEARRSSRRKVPPLEFWRGQVVLRDPGSGDVVDIAEGAPDFVTGGAHYVKLECGDVDARAATGASPAAHGSAPAEAGASRTASGEAGSSASKRGVGKGAAKPSTRGTARLESQAPAGARAAAAPEGQPPGSDSRKAAAKKPSGHAGARRATRQAPHQNTSSSDGDATTSSGEPGAMARAGRQQRGAAVAAKGFAAAAAAANRGHLMQRCPGPAAAAKARQQQAAAASGGTPALLPGSKRKRPLHDAAAAAAATTAAASAVPGAMAQGEVTDVGAEDAAAAAAAGAAASRPGKRQRGKGQPAAAPQAEAATQTPRPACRDPRKVACASSHTSAAELPPASGQQALRSHDGRLVLRMPAAAAYPRQPQPGVQCSEAAAAVRPPAPPAADAAAPSGQGFSRRSSGADGSRQQPAARRQPQQERGHSDRPVSQPAAVQQREQQQTAPAADDSAWTTEQESALAAAQEACDPTRNNYWQLVARRVPGKSPQQCYDKSLERHPTPKATKRGSKQVAPGAALPLPRGRKDGKPGAAVRKYVHEVQLQEHLGNMRASRQELSPGASDGEREAELQAAEAARRQKQRYVDGFNRRHGGGGRQPADAAAPAKPAIVRPIPRDKIGVAALIDLAIAKGSGPCMDDQEEDSDEDKDCWFDDD